MAISVVMAAAVLLVGPPSGGGMDPPPYVSCIGTNILTRALDSNETHVVEYHKDAIKGGVSISCVLDFVYSNWFVGSCSAAIQIARCARSAWMDVSNSSHARRP